MTEKFLGKYWYIRIFRVADYKSAVKFEKFKMAVQRNRQNLKKYSNFFRENWYKRVFRVADYESCVVQFPKFGIAVSI